MLSRTVTYTESGTPMLNWDSRYICQFSTEMAEIWSPGISFKMFWHAKFQLSISCTFIVMKHLVKITKYTTKTFITLKVQEIESWNFACPNILKRCAWRPNFSHFGWEMTKISTVPVQHNCPTFSFPNCNLIEIVKLHTTEDHINFNLPTGTRLRGYVNHWSTESAF